MNGRIKRALGDAGGLTQFGVNLTTLEPGAMSALRHWHASEDEFVYVLERRARRWSPTRAKSVLGPGMAAPSRPARPTAHHLINRSTVAATYLEIGTRSKDDVMRPIPTSICGLRSGMAGAIFVRKSGEPYE